jgi:hypothetical protein
MSLLATDIKNPQDAIVISFDEEGGAEALHIDKFDLGFLGKKHITRATDIKFDDEGQTWTIYLLDKNGENPELAWKGCKGLPSYEVARSVEVAWLNLCRVNGVNPRGGEGNTFLNKARLANGLTI